MNETLKSIEDYPEISFIENYTIEQLEEDMISWYKEKKKELTGKPVVMASGDERRLILSACAYFIYHGYKYIDLAGKMGLLKYSRQDYLENVGAMKHISRKGAVGANTTIRFTILDARTVATPIPKGTRMTAGDNVYFETDEYAEIRIGETYVDVPATCLTTGSAGNEYDIGDINIIVDPVAFVDGASNITKPENGADIEDDDNLRNRIYIAPATYSTAGSEDAYKALVLEFNPSITDVVINSPSERVVEIRYLLDDGQIPGEESIKGLQDHMSSKTVRPLTDLVQVKAPDAMKFKIELTYWINQSDAQSATSIQQAVAAAVAEYSSWQCGRIGRDLNPDELNQRVIAAGAKRVSITSPVYTVIQSTQVASVNGSTVNYGGLEDD